MKSKTKEKKNFCVEFWFRKYFRETLIKKKKENKTMFHSFELLIFVQFFLILCNFDEIKAKSSTSISKFCSMFYKKQWFNYFDLSNNSIRSFEICSVAETEVSVAAANQCLLCPEMVIRNEKKNFFSLIWN